MRRREVLLGMGAAVAGQVVPATAAVPGPSDRNATPPWGSRAEYIDWMVRHRGEDPAFLGERYDRFVEMVAHADLWNDRNKRAFLMTPRERFVTTPNLDRAYQVHFLDIGYGVTITGPNSVGRMTNSIDLQFGDKVLEIGTGSGYQSAYLSNLTDQVYTIEIIEPLFKRTGALYDRLIGEGYSEYKAIARKSADGYYGWPENAPFDKIIVTCGIDHIPPPLLQQLRPNGVMVIPIGPPGAQHVLKVVKNAAADGTITVSRSDIYHGSIVNFVPFTKLDNGAVRGTHSG